MTEIIPKISVAVPVFNTEKYLAACLNSILSQSMQDFEIIAVNDASTDGSPQILSDYAAKDPRIRIVAHKCNKGLLAARISGVRAARGKYLVFLDSDDVFLPGFLKNLWLTAERKQADIVHFPLVNRDRNHSISPSMLRRAEKKSQPYAGELFGTEVFRKYFVENAYGWSAVQKLYRTEVCRMAADHIPEGFCLMGEDFCFYTVCSYFAKHYVPMKKAGYVYFMESGITTGRKTSLEKFLGRQSPLQALRNVRDFLRKQKVPTDIQEAFARQEPRVLAEQFMRWMRYLPDEDRTIAFNTFFRQYDQDVLFAALRRFFTGRDEHFLELLTGEDPVPVSCPAKFMNPWHVPVLQYQAVSLARWKEWIQLIGANHYDAVILPPDDDADRLFWDIRAVREAGAAAVCRREKSCLDTLESRGVKDWLIEDRILRQASAVLTPDEESTAWYRRRNCHAGITLEGILPPQKDSAASSFMSALEASELARACYRIEPSPDGETFVPFFRKLDHLFRKNPSGFRKKLFGFLGRTYNRICGY